MPATPAPSGIRLPRRPLAIAGLAAAGLAAGAAAKAADLVPGGAASAVTSGLAIWMLLLALIARFSRGPRRAALRSAVFFLAMVITYYAVSVLVLRYLVTPRLVLAWSVAAVTACPALAAGLQWCFRSRRGRAAALIGVAAGAVFIDGAAERILLALQQPDLSLGARPLAAALELVAAVVIAAVLPRAPKVRVLSVVVAVSTAVVLLPVIERLVYGSGIFA